MKRSYSVCTLVALFLLAGCRDEKDNLVHDVSRKLSADFDRHFAMMTNANTEGHAFADGVMQELLSVSDPALRKRLLSRWRQSTLKFDYHSLPFTEDNDPRRGRCMSMMDDLFTKVFPRAAASEEEKWRIKLEYLGWLRARAIAVATKRPYPKGVFATKDNRLAKVHGYNKALEEYKRWLRRYNGFSHVYELRLFEFESLFQHVKVNMAPETVKRIADEIERFLGRKVRTKEQCDSDFYGKRRVELPEYVPTPEGIKEAWSKAEAENMEKGALQP